MKRTSTQWALIDAGALARRPAYLTIDEWVDVSAMSRREVYRALAAGNLKSIKRGVRTLIDVEFGLAWLQSLPPAKIRPMRRPQPVELETA